MGKIKTEGRVTLEFDPDLYEISITVRAEGKTSGAAVTAGKKQTEQLLQSLQDKLQIKPEQLSAEREDVSVPYNQDCYSFSRTLLLKIPADNQARETVTGMLADMDAIGYSVEAKLSDESDAKKTAINAAVKYAKEKAEHLAASMDCRIISFDEICTDGTGFEERGNAVYAYGAAPRMKDLAANLQNPKIHITGEVTVVWLTEPLT